MKNNSTDLLLALRSTPKLSKEVSSLFLDDPIAWLRGLFEPFSDVEEVLMESSEAVNNINLDEKDFSYILHTQDQHRDKVTSKFHREHLAPWKLAKETCRPGCAQHHHCRQRPPRHCWDKYQKCRRTCQTHLQLWKLTLKLSCGERSHRMNCLRNNLINHQCHVQPLGPDANFV